MFTKYLCVTFIITTAFVKAIPIDPELENEGINYDYMQGDLVYEMVSQVRYDLNGNPIDVNSYNRYGGEDEREREDQHGDFHIHQHVHHVQFNEAPKPVTTEEPVGYLRGLYNKASEKMNNAASAGSEKLQSAIKYGKSALETAKSKWG